MYPTNNGQGPHSPFIMLKSQIFSCPLILLPVTRMTSVVQASTNRVIHLTSAMVFGLLRQLDGWTTDHVTLFLCKQFIQFDAPSIGIAHDSYFYLCFDFKSLIRHQIMSHLWYHWNSSYIVYLHMTWV